MTNTYNPEDNWMSVSSFSEISSTIDGEREFLEAIVQFKIEESLGKVTENGYLMPPLKGLNIGPIVEILFVNNQQNINDGVIKVRKPN